MYDSDIIEFRDTQFNHFIHHFNEIDEVHIDFNEEYECIETLAECMEEIIWQ